MNSGYGQAATADICKSSGSRNRYCPILPLVILFHPNACAAPWDQIACDKDGAGTNWRPVGLRPDADLTSVLMPTCSDARPCNAPCCFLRNKVGVPDELATRCGHPRGSSPLHPPWPGAPACPSRPLLLAVFSGPRLSQTSARVAQMPLLKMRVSTRGL